MKKIIVVVDSIDVNDSSGSKANVALIQNLAAIGYEVKVYHYTQKKIELPSIECVSIPELKWNVWYLLSRSQRIFTRYTKININPLVEKLFGFSFTFFNDSNSIRKALEKEKTFQPYWVLTLSKAASFRPHKALLGIPKWHDKWLVYVHDPYPEHCYPRPYDWVEPGHQFKRDFFWRITDKAKYVIYPSQLLAEWMRGYYFNQTGKEVIIPHQINKDLCLKVQESNILGKNEFSLMHAGSLMDARNPNWLIEGFLNFLQNNPEAMDKSKLYFIGPPSRFDEYIKDIQKKYPQIYISNGYMPFEEVCFLMNKVSVNIILEAISTISPFLPGKFPNVIEANKPLLLLGPYYSESKRLLGNDYEYWSEINDSKKIEILIAKLYNNWKKNINQKLNREDLSYYLSYKNLMDLILILQ